MIQRDTPPPDSSTEIGSRVDFEDLRYLFLAAASGFTLAVLLFAIGVAAGLVVVGFRLVTGG